MVLTKPVLKAYRQIIYNGNAKPEKTYNKSLEK
jgi:hypothetical protein